MNYKPFESLQKAAESARTGEPLSRRDFIIGAAEATVGLAALQLFGSCTSSYVSFADARKDYRVRQKYVEQSVRENPPPAKLDSAVYRHENSPEGWLVMDMDFDFSHGTGKDATAELRVYRDAFEYLVSRDEFLSSLLDHEYEHLRLVKSGVEIEIPVEAVSELPRISMVGGDLQEYYWELDAFYRQIKAFRGRRDVRDSFKDKVRDKYRFYRQQIEKKQKTPLTASLLKIYPPDP